MEIMQVEHATGLPVVPSSGVIGSNPVLASVGMPIIQQFSLQQQPLASVSQTSIIQTSFPQLHVHPPVLPQHHPSAQHQVIISTFYAFPKSDVFISCKK